jgi:hypothetical protein
MVFQHYPDSLLEFLERSSGMKAESPTIAGVLPNDYLASFEEGGMLFLQNYKGCFHSF